MQDCLYFFYFFPGRNALLWQVVVRLLFCGGVFVCENLSAFVTALIPPLFFGAATTVRPAAFSFPCKCGNWLKYCRRCAGPNGTVSACVRDFLLYTAAGTQPAKGACTSTMKEEGEGRTSRWFCVSVLPCVCVRPTPSVRLSVEGGGAGIPPGNTWVLGWKGKMAVFTKYFIGSEYADYIC